MGFVLIHIWTTSKIQFFFILVSLLIYLLNYEDFYKIIFSINNIIINILMIYSLVKKDDYLKSNGFYNLFNVLRLNLLISKSIIIFIVLSIHLSLVLIYAFKTTLINCLLFDCVLFLIIINNIILSNTKWKIVFLSILIFILTVFIIIFSVNKIILFMPILIVINVSVLFRVYRNKISLTL